MRSQAVQEASQRIRSVRIGFLVCFLILAGRATHLSLIDERTRKLSDQQFQTTLDIAPARGSIVDRTHKSLALTLQAPSVYVSPSDFEDQDFNTRRSLAKILRMDRDQIATRLEGRRRFTYLARWISDEQAAAIEALGANGVGIVREPRRAYPAGSLAGRIIGFADIDGQGVRGIEQQEDAFLRGRGQSARIERDAKGGLLIGSAPLPQDSTGGDIALTIDAAMQAEAESALLAVVKERGASGGVVVSLDPSTGDILALAEAPGFDPNRFREVSYLSTRSRALLDAMEPGSTFKVFLTAAALEAGVVNERTSFDCTGGEYQVKGKTFHDHDDYGRVNLAKLIAVSSNCGAVQLAERLGPELHYEALRRFGFGARTGSGFPFESAGLLRDWNKWKPVDHATIAFGQGVSATPIQIATALGAIANDGILLPPRLVAGRRETGGAWQDEPGEKGRRVLSKETARSVLAMMTGVVSTEGTGRKAGLADVTVAGKTGTAQKFDTERKRYSHNEYTAWFMGAVPADDPQLVIVVGIDAPRGPIRQGGDVAAPLFARVAADQLARLGTATHPQPFPPKPRKIEVAKAKPAKAKKLPAVSSPARTKAQLAARVVAKPAAAKPARKTLPTRVSEEPAAPPSRVVLSARESRVEQRGRRADTGLSGNDDSGGQATRVGASARARALGPRPRDPPRSRTRYGGERKPSQRADSLHGKWRSRRANGHGKGEPLMRLSALLAALSPDLAPIAWRRSDPSDDPVIRGIAYDSRAVVPGDLFVALRGSESDGHEFLDKAINHGAAAALVEELPEDEHGICCAVVPDTRRALAPVATRFYGNAATELQLIGVTGTNGKTSTTYLVESILARAGVRVGLVGTVEIRYAGEHQRSVNTTPESLDLQRTLRGMLNNNVEAVVMEVSSHGLELGRVSGCHFAVGAVTNLTQDHLDFHGSMDSYWASKARLFRDHLVPGGHAIINIDDPSAEKFIGAAADAGARILRTTRDSSLEAEIVLREADTTLEGTNAKIETPRGVIDLSSPLVGDFNLENLLVACGIAEAMGIAHEAIAVGVAECPQIPGRMELVPASADDAPTVIVDYAHTPDAVAKLLGAVRPLAPGRVIAVFGCGGDRDRAKRPLMAEAVAAASDLAIATSDNPRTEDPHAILRDVVAGLASMTEVPLEELAARNGSYAVSEDRRAAILAAIRQAAPNDTVVIAGKGHEDYQIVGRTRLPFDDRAEARRALAQRGDE